MPAIQNIVVLAVGAICMLVCPATSFAGKPVEERPLLLANYYAWYHTGAHARWPWAGWTRTEAERNPLALAAQRDGEPPLSSAAYPLIGPYESADKAIAEWHVKLAQAAGIDAMLVDWWDTHNERDRNIDRGILAAAEKHGFKFAILDERAQYHNDWDWYKDATVRTLARYKDSDSYLRISGRPVFYLYQVASNPTLTPDKFAELKRYVEGKVGPVYWIVDKIAHDPVARAAGESDKEKRIPADWLAAEGVDALGFYSTFSHFRAHRYEELLGKYRYLTRQAHEAGKKMLLPVHPGHDNSHFRDDPYVMPRREGQTLRDYLRAAVDAEADFVMVTSWNEWPETTVIEPSSTWPDPYLYLRILAEWKGKVFQVPPEPGEVRRQRQ
ncbi:MAG TPA: glycoside hydrolase family 99-like domain-containing protein [Thermoguttaceae bacterium]|nr:glycoside hydrolase family 99-like domain-containing protein [Thermoguttaceae bacterium]